MMTGLIKGVGVTELNSNIGCFEIFLLNQQVSPHLVKQ